MMESVCIIFIHIIYMYTVQPQSQTTDMNLYECMYIEINARASIHTQTQTNTHTRKAHSQRTAERRGRNDTNEEDSFSGIE